MHASTTDTDHWLSDVSLTYDERTNWSRVTANAMTAADAARLAPPHAPRAHS